MTAAKAKSVSKPASKNRLVPFVHPKALVETRAIGPGTRVWAFAHVMKGAVVGSDCNVGDHAFIENDVTVGDRVTIKNGVAVWNGVTLENDVFVGPNAVFTNDLRPISRGEFHLGRTRVKCGAAIGANSTVICGNTVGRYALVGAGSVVTKDVPDHALVYGNPARVRAFLCFCRKELSFKAGRARCVCGKKYQKTTDGVAAL